MFGGPFFSQGVARIINGITYRYRGVTYAHWVSYYTGGESPNHYEITRGRKVLAKVKTLDEVEKFFDSVAASK